MINEKLNFAMENDEYYATQNESSRDGEIPRFRWFILSAWNQEFSRIIQENITLSK